MSSKTQSAPQSAKPVQLKLTIPSGQAVPGPPIGPALGQRGIKAIDFCRQFNDQSAKLYQPGIPLRCLLTVNPADRSFSITVRPPATSWLLKRAAGIDKASSRFRVARMSVKVLFEVAKMKARDPIMAQLPSEAVFRSVLATARSCGFDIF